jgi:hypothetical protein
MKSNHCAHAQNPNSASVSWGMRSVLLILVCILGLHLTGYADSNYWTYTNGPGSGNDVRSLAVDSKGRVLSGTWSSGGTVWRSSDNGVSWRQLGVVPNGDPIVGICLNGLDHIFISVFTKGVCRSTDDGATWQIINNGLLNYRVRGNLVDKNGYIWVSSEGGLHRSTDNGDTWINKLAANVGVVYLDSTNAIVTQDSYSIYRSTDAGNSWSTTPDVGGIGLGGIHSDGSFIGCTSNSGVYRSTDRGTTWVNLNNPFAWTGYTAAFAFTAKGDIFYAKDGDVAGVAMSSDMGATWVAVNSGLTTTRTIPLLYTPNGYVYVGTNGGGVFRSTAPMVKGVLQIQVAGRYGATLGTAGRVVLLDSLGRQVAEQSTNASGLATFHGVGSGVKYQFKVYNHQSTDSLPWGDCFWGGGKIVASSQSDSTLVAFTPTTPRILSTKVFIDSTSELLVAGGLRSIAPDCRLRIEIEVSNPLQAGTTAGAYVSVILDRDKVAPYDRTVHSAAQALDAGDSGTYVMYCTPSVLGKYYMSGAVTSWTDVGDSAVTDGVVWQSPAFQVQYRSPWSYVNTGSTHTIVIPLSGYYSINNASLRVGDYVGVFYDSSGTAVCAGYEAWTGTGNIAVAAFGDDPTTPQKDGFGAGEAFTWKISRPDSGIIYKADASYAPVGGVVTNTGTFATNGVSYIQALTDPGAQQCPVLRAGWSLISSNVAPYVTALDSVFGPVLSDVIILKNGAQNSYIPSVQVNTIGPWNSLEGYQLKMRNARMLCFNGQKIVPQAQALSIPAGWSIIPYYRDSVMSIITALGGIVSDVILVKDQDGRIYLPSLGVNTIVTMKPGEGYYIKLTAAHSLLYPASRATVAESPSASLAKGTSGPPWTYNNTGVSHTIIVPLNSGPQIAGVALTAGDCIGVFYDSSGTMACAGYTIWNGGSNAAIAAFGDDATTAQKDGFNTGEVIRWKIWRQTDAHVYTGQAAYLAPGSLGGIVTDTSRYVSNGISAVAALSGSLTGVGTEAGPNRFTLGQNYPNPFNPSTVVSCQLPVAGHVRLVVYDLLGKEVAVLMNGELPAGEHRFTFDAAGLASGVYLYRITAGEHTAMKRMVLVR